MENVEDVADFLLEFYSDNEEPITNMTLNKLLYFAQGHCLAEYGEPLFEDTIEAWKYGPVVPKIYKKYKVCGSKAPLFPEEGVLSSQHLKPETMALLAAVVNQYKCYSGIGMSRLTHEKGSPWELVYDPNHQHNPISIASIAKDFEGKTLDDFEDDDLDEDEMQAIEEYERVKAEGTLKTYTLEEVRERCGLAD